MKYTRKQLEEAVRKSCSFREVAKRLGAKNPATSANYLSKRVKQVGISIDHFDPHRRKYSKEILEALAKRHTSSSAICRELGLKPNGETAHHIRRMLKKFKVDISHFKKGGFPKPKQKLSPEEIFLPRKNGYRQSAQILRRGLREMGVKEICFECKIGTTYNGKSLRLQVDHINGNSLDDCLGNLRFLCPNCHSQTETFGSRNKGHTEDKELVDVEDCPINLNPFPTSKIKES